ncbi:hypothetical protein D4764_18G0009760 [Takifugu flavidus]|uniref:Uncharacterized protein n=1 Tax=Takifugu flavidus TaxID=433684 RepID=A0A5C6NVM8_9TELE|nr:hypothetical protein D4764_18G0009760 [Takifugu flavidus]
MAHVSRSAPQSQPRSAGRKEKSGVYSTRGGFPSASGCMWNPARPKSPPTLPWWRRQDFKINKGNSGLSASPWLSLRVSVRSRSDAADDAQRRLWPLRVLPVFGSGAYGAKVMMVNASEAPPLCKQRRVTAVKVSFILATLSYILHQGCTT